MAHRRILASYNARKTHLTSKCLISYAPTTQLVGSGRRGRRSLHVRQKAKAIGEAFRSGVPVIMNVTDLGENEAKRLVDFAAGLVFGLHGSIERVTTSVFLLSPAHVEIGYDTDFLPTAVDVTLRGSPDSPRRLFLHRQPLHGVPPQVPDGSRSVSRAAGQQVESPESRRQGDNNPAATVRSGHNHGRSIGSRGLDENDGAARLDLNGRHTTRQWWHPLRPRVSQGSGDASTMEGDEVTVEAVVTYVTSTGFFLQEEDADADGNAATSEGLFIYTGSAPTAAAGGELGSAATEDYPWLCSTAAG